jgi:uncharacterized membrane protein YkvA (DUF1232 family)
MEQSRYQGEYTSKRFWHKAGRHARSAGRATLEKALYLYYAAQSANTPKWAKRVIYGALGYFIFPLDAIPDLIPIIGYTDDLSIMAAALVTVAFYITPEVKEQAHQKLARWFDGAQPGATDGGRARL